MKSSFFRLPTILAVAVISSFTFAMPASAKDEHGRKSDDRGRNHGDGQRSSRGGQSHRDHVHTLFCGNHKHHHVHVWHGRDHRDYRCPGHK